MGNYSNAFKKVANAKPINDYAKNIGLGRHIVALKSFKSKESAKKKDEPFVEAEFVILASLTETEQVGATRGWAWFISETGWSGEYAAGRLQKFIGVVIDATSACGVFAEEDGSEPDIESLGNRLSDEENNEGFGIVLEVEVEQVMDKTTGLPAKSKKSNRDIHNASWTAPEQTVEDILATREKVQELLANFKPEVKKTNPAPATESQKPTTIPTKSASAGVRSLLGKK